MPSLSTARRIANAKTNNAKTIGQIYKEQSDDLMEWTWEADEQSKFCYIYDWKHDDSPNMNIGMTYENTTKTPIDAKILVSMVLLIRTLLLYNVNSNQVRKSILQRMTIYSIWKNIVRSTN